MAGRASEKIGAIPCAPHWGSGPCQAARRCTGQRTGCSGLARVTRQSLFTSRSVIMTVPRERSPAGLSGLIDLGRWQALEDWLDRLPSGVSAVYPNFDYLRAEMTAARGDSVTAGRLYDSAAARYADRNDTFGASRSMLAASAAAANAGDLVTARARARAACSLVETAGAANDANAATVRMWAAWQEGRVALVTGDTDHALASFGWAAAAASGGAAAEPIRKAGQFATRVAELRREQESHREAEAALSRAEHQVLGELLACVRAPGGRDGGVQERGRLVRRARRAEDARAGRIWRGGSRGAAVVDEAARPAARPACRRGACQRLRWSGVSGERR